MTPEQRDRTLALLGIRRFDPGQPRDPHTGEWIDIPGAGELVHDLTERLGAALSGPDALDAASLRDQPSAPQLAAIDRYGGDGGYVINIDLREQSGDLDALQSKNRSSTEQLDSVMEAARIPKDTVVVRHIGSGRRTFGEHALAADLTGLTWRDHAFVSTSVTDRGVTGGHRMSMRILVPAGTAGFSHQYLDSDEILLDRGLTFKVVEDLGMDSSNIRRLVVMVVS